MRRVLLGLLALGLASGALACANGLLAEEDAGVDGSIADASGGDAQPKDAGGKDAIVPGDAGCPGTTKLCGAICVDVQNDPEHCGTCQNVCPAPDGGVATCAAGVCDFSCGDGGLSKCGAACVDEKSDPLNCGACGASCDGGACCSSQCTDTTTDDLNCGACGKACDAGTCLSSTCQLVTTYKVGNSTLFASKSSHAPDYLLGSRITLSKAAKLVDFGLISVSSGAHVVMALYTEASGHPGTLVAYTSSTALTSSDQQIAPNVQASLPAGNYWIMAVYDTSASVGIDYGNSTAEVDYISFTFGTTLPSTFPAPTTYTGQQFNYYLLVE